MLVTLQSHLGDRTCSRTYWNNLQYLYKIYINSCDHTVGPIVLNQVFKHVLTTTTSVYIPKHGRLQDVCNVLLFHFLRVRFISLQIGDLTFMII